MLLVRVHLLKQLLLFLLPDQLPVDQQSLPQQSPARAACGFHICILEVQGTWGLLSCSSSRFTCSHVNPQLETKPEDSFFFKPLLFFLALSVVVEPGLAAASLLKVCVRFLPCRPSSAILASSFAVSWEGGGLPVFRHGQRHFVLGIVF